MTNPNLIPTTVTDKNGRVTTVYKKLFETPTSPWSTPPPPGGWPKPPQVEEPRIRPYSDERMENPTGTEAERAQCLSAITKVLKNSDLGAISHILGTLEKCKDIDYLKRAQFVVEHYEKPWDLYDLSYGLSSYDPTRVDVAYSYHHLVGDRDSDRSLQKLVEFHKNILKDHPRRMDENGGLKAIEAHLYARDHATVPASHTRMGRYAETVDNEDLVALVDQYADNVVSLVAYVAERGYDNFDHDSFAEYLSNGPVAGGWL